VCCVFVKVSNRELRNVVVEDHRKNRFLCQHKRNPAFIFDYTCVSGTPLTWPKQYKRGYLNTSQLCVTSRKMKNPFPTKEEAWNYAQLKLSCILLQFGGAPFESWAERRKFLLRLIVGLLSTSKKLHNNRLTSHPYLFIITQYYST